MNNPYKSPAAADDPGAESIEKSRDTVSLRVGRPAFFYILIPLMLLTAFVLGRLAMQHGPNLFGSEGSAFDEAPSMRTILHTWRLPVIVVALIASATGLWAGQRIGWWILLSISCFLVGQSLPVLYFVVSKSGFHRLSLLNGGAFCLRTMLLIYCFSSGPMRYCGIGDDEGNQIMPVVAATLFAGICVSLAW